MDTITDYSSFSGGHDAYCDFLINLEANSNDSSNTSSVNEKDTDVDTPHLPCLVSVSPTLESGKKVKACPDSGCTMSLISKNLARKIGVRILRTRIKLYGSTGASIKLAGQAIIFVKVKRVPVKRLTVLVVKKVSDDLTISYRDLITLRV